jgi:hypothetical protein
MALSPSQVSAVIVTRGDVDLRPILALLPFDDIIVYDNSKEQDYKVYGRYRAIRDAKRSIIYTQDDDCTVDAHAVVANYRSGYVTANVPPDRRAFYSDGVTLVGWGSIFDRTAADVFERYLKRWPMDDLFLRECDRVFTGLNRCRNIDVPFQHLPHAHGTDRMGSERRHLKDLAEIRRRIHELK